MASEFTYINQMPNFNYKNGNTGKCSLYSTSNPFVVNRKVMHFFAELSDKRQKVRGFDYENTGTG